MYQMCEDKKRIRIINCQNAPIEIAAYSVHNIKLENVHIKEQKKFTDSVKNILINIKSLWSS